MNVISEVTIRPVKPDKGLVGFASLVLDSSLYIGSMGIYARLDGSGYRVTYPSRRVGDKELNTYHPINAALANAIENAVNDECVRIFGSGAVTHD